MNITKSACAVIIAAKNEEKHIATVVKKVKRQGFATAIVVDDGSNDRTGKLAESAGAIVLRHVTNLGKGAAMKTGADYAARQKTVKALIFIDADGQHRPEELPLFIIALNKGYDIAFGYRKRTSTMPFVLRFGNWFISALANVLYGINLRDSQCGYRAMTVSAYKRLRWTSRSYSVESEIIANAGKRRLRYTEFEIATIYHDRYKGTTFLDGFPIVWNLLRWRLTK